jgi:hypothetical protein
MILGLVMHSEYLLYEQDNYTIAGFINSNGDLEHNIYKQVDGGHIDLEDSAYDKDDLLNLLETELEGFVNRNLSTTVIIGHNIRIAAIDGQHIVVDDLDEEIYEINQSILDGSYSGDIFVRSLNINASWHIVI